MNEVNVKLKYLRIAPRKVRLVADLIRNLCVNEAEAQLLLSPKRGARPLLKLLRSGIDIALKQKKMKYENLWIKEIKVDSGPVLKRYRARARGAVNTIQKKSSHITLVLQEKEEKYLKYKFIKQEKKKKKKLIEQKAKEKIKETKEKERAHKEDKEKIKSKKGRGLFKIFRRKAIP